jgi:hypothetical protein
MTSTQFTKAKSILDQLQQTETALRALEVELATDWQRGNGHKIELIGNGRHSTIIAIHNLARLTKNEY